MSDLAEMLDAACEYGVTIRLSREENDTDFPILRCQVRAEVDGVVYSHSHLMARASGDSAELLLATTLMPLIGRLDRHVTGEGA